MDTFPQAEWGQVLDSQEPHTQGGVRSFLSSLPQAGDWRVPPQVAAPGGQAGNPVPFPGDFAQSKTKAHKQLREGQHSSCSPSPSKDPTVLGMRQKQHSPAYAGGIGSPSVTRPWVEMPYLWGRYKQNPSGPAEWARSR